MLETALVFGHDNQTLYWHMPLYRSAAYLPDSSALWNFIWQNRDRVKGVAHTHPWNGQAFPSMKDVTTFDAIERGLGRKLLWPIVTMTNVTVYHRDGELGYVESLTDLTGLDINGLRERSNNHWVEKIAVEGTAEVV